MLLFDQGLKHHKEEFTAKEKDIIVDKLVSENSLKEQLDYAVDRILLAHRNTRLFLFMMTGPCLLILMCIKYTIKGILVMHFWRKHKAKKAA